jgi:pyruvate,water dikinase
MAAGGGETPGGADFGAGMEPGGVRFLFRSFKRILALNTQALERMAEMDRALGGDYVFDRAFLESSVRDVCRLTHLVAYHLNGMDGEGSVALYDAVLAAKDALEEILSGGMGPLASEPVLAFADIGLEMEPVAGLCATGLAVLGRRMGLPAPDGFAVTVSGMAALARQSGADGIAHAEARFRVLRAAESLPGPLLLTYCVAGHGQPTGNGRVLAEELAPDAAGAARLIAAFAASNAVLGPVAACVRPAARPNGQVAAQGALQTLAHDPSLPPAMLVIAEPAEGSRTAGAEDGPRFPADRIWVSRSAPHLPLRSRIAAKDFTARLPAGRATDLYGAMLRGSAWLTPGHLADLAELGLAAERALDSPCVLGWALGAEGSFVLTGVEPAEAAFPEMADEGNSDGASCGMACPPPSDLLLSGGQVACSGVAAGPVLPLSEDTLPESVPLGSVGTARAASPALSRLVPRLGALLAEVGTAASHLATVAREHRVPAIFGLAGAQGLRQGQMVTVDAEQGAVYRGVAEGLLAQAAVERARMGAAPEYQTLRRLLRHIRPLNLHDPNAPDFRPERCRTCHDVIHYAHERAVELLLAMDPGLGGGLGGARRLAEDAPFELRVVDLGGGLSSNTGDLRLGDVDSLPLRAFLEGLLLRGVRRQEPARLSLGDIVSGLGRTSRAMNAAPEAAGLNLALAARGYANITLRLGYHFSVVDAVADDRPEQNFVYFRFAGGFASEDRRARRAGLIERTLTRLGYRCLRKGDLVVARRKLLAREEALESLRLLGALSAFTRQLDAELASEADVARFARDFLEACADAGLDASADRPGPGGQEAEA